MNARPLQMRPMTPDEVVELLQSHHDFLGRDAGADRIVVSKDTRVKDLVWCWPGDDCSIRKWPSAARILNDLFDMDVPLSEWRLVLTPMRRKTIQEIAEFVAERALVPEVPAFSLLGKPCRTAGAFLTIQAMLEERGVDTSKLSPGTCLSEYARSGMPEIYMQLMRAAPSLLPRIEPTYRGELGNLFLAGFLLLGTIPFSLLAAARSIALGAPLAMLCFGLFVLVWWSSEKRTDKPIRVDINGVNDFRDLSRILAGQPMGGGIDTRS